MAPRRPIHNPRLIAKGDREHVETRTSTKGGKLTGLCPICGVRLAFRERLLVGEIIPCDQCDEELEVAGLGPLVFAPLAKIEEDEEDFES